MTSRLQARLLAQRALFQRIQSSKNQKKGFGAFTLIELLIVVIIVGILSAIALPAFLNQANRAKASAAKSLVSSAAKNCQVALVEGTAGTGWDRGLEGSQEIELTGDTCATNTDNVFETTIVGSNPTESFEITVASDGTIGKSCTGTNGCDTTQTPPW